MRTNNHEKYQELSWNLLKSLEVSCMLVNKKTLAAFYKLIVLI